MKIRKLYKLSTNHKQSDHVFLHGYDKPWEIQLSHINPGGTLGSLDFKPYKL